MARATKEKAPPGPYGLMAEFAEEEAVITAAERAYSEGYRRMDAYSPFPVEALDEALGIRTTFLPKLVFIGGVTGCLFGFGLQWYATVIDYPFNIGGRPYNSWPAYAPITFELTILFSVLTCVLGMLALNKLPEFYHPVFNVPRFRRVTTDHFFLCIQSDDPKFNLDSTRAFLEGLNPQSVSVVEP